MKTSTFEQWCDRLQLSTATRDFLAHLRSSPPARRVQTCDSVSKAKLKEQSVVITPHPPRKVRAVRNVTRWMEQGTAWILVQKKE
jgi:hypothetical protein